MTEGTRLLSLDRAAAGSIAPETPSEFPRVTRIGFKAEPAAARCSKGSPMAAEAQGSVRIGPYRSLSCRQT